LRKIYGIENKNSSSWRLVRVFFMQTTFAEVLETIETFTVDEKETLIDILQHRLAEYRRNQLLKDIKSSEKEFEKGLCKPMSVDEFMKEVMS